MTIKDFVSKLLRISAEHPYEGNAEVWIMIDGEPTPVVDVLFVTEALKSGNDVVNVMMISGQDSE